ISSDSLTAYTEPVPGSNAFSTVIQGSRSGSPPEYLTFSFGHPSPTSGTYPIHFVEVNLLISNNLISPSNVIVSNFPQNIGEFYEGTFSGSFQLPSSGTHTLSGIFRIRKTR
ncbi:MAG TPA: hypothetical protein VGD33_09385, partial [Chitinophagaceae bacterium]